MKNRVRNEETIDCERKTKTVSELTKRTRLESHTNENRQYK